MHHGQLSLSQECKVGLTSKSQLMLTHHTNRIKGEIVIISINIAKAFGKIQNPLWIFKNQQKQK